MVRVRSLNAPRSRGRNGPGFAPTAPIKAVPARRRPLRLAGLPADRGCLKAPTRIKAPDIGPKNPAGWVEDNSERMR